MVVAGGWSKWEKETKPKHVSSLPGDRVEKLEIIAGPWLVQLGWLLAMGSTQQLFFIALLGTAELHFTAHRFESSVRCFCTARGGGGKKVMLSRGFRPF